MIAEIRMQNRHTYGMLYDPEIWLHYLILQYKLKRFSQKLLICYTVSFDLNIRTHMHTQIYLH